jgi:cobaltochelatase CobT
MSAMAKSESPLEPFKRALAHAARSLAEQPDLEVVFGGEGPSLVGPQGGHPRAVLPHPPRDMSEKEAARFRGLADQMALRLAHHDEGAHARLKPFNAAGAGLFEALEGARTNAIGANALAGVRENLGRLLEHDLERRGLTRAVDRTAVPWPEVMALMVRERLTGDAPPDGARAVVDLVRAEIEAKAGADLDRLAGALGDQEAFGRIVRSIVSDLDMGDDASDPADEGEDQEAEGRSRIRARARRATMRPMSRRSRPGPARRASPSARRTGARRCRPTWRSSPSCATTRPRRRGGARGAAGGARRLGRGAALQGLYDGVRRGGGGRRPLRSGGADASAGLSGSAAGGLVLGGGAAGQPAAAAAAGAAEPGVDLRPEEGMLDTARLVRVVTDPTSPLSLQAGGGGALPRHGVTLLLDNSGSMRGRPIMVAAVCADILARTLERCGVKVEVLGFTTRAWKGGLSRDDWIKAANPPSPAA